MLKIKTTIKKLEELVEHSATIARNVLVNDGYLISNDQIPDDHIEDTIVVKNSNGSLKMVKLKKDVE